MTVRVRVRNIYEIEGAARQFCHTDRLDDNGWFLGLKDFLENYCDCNASNDNGGAPSVSGVIFGDGAPLSGDGENGDVWVDKSVDPWDYYRKAGGAWGPATSLQGPEGPEGPAGPQGDAGPAGADGAAGQSFFDWFASTIGDQDGDNVVTQEDVRQWLNGVGGEPTPEPIVIQSTGDQPLRNVQPFAVRMPGQRIGVYFESGAVTGRTSRSGSTQTYGSGADNALAGAIGANAEADDPARWTVNGQAATAVSRKTLLVDSARNGEFWAVNTDWIYGTWVTLDIPGGVDLDGSLSIAFNHSGFSTLSGPLDTTLVHPAVHCSQSGFHPSEPKHGYASWWAGLDGSDQHASLDFAGRAWRVRRVSDNGVATSGTLALETAKTQPYITGLPADANYNRADTFVGDFSSLTTEGDYYFEVDGLGRSYPFTIAKNQVEKHLRYLMAGIYNARSGIDKEAQYGGWDAPGGQKQGFTFQTTSVPIIETTEGGLEAPSVYNRNDATNGFAANVTGTTTDGWGGHHDAGDWDRRWQGLLGPIRAALVLEAMPAARAATLSIPESGGQVPDVAAEMLWEIDFFRRLQEPDGGVRGGVDAANYPGFGSLSWDNSETWYAYAPDPHTSCMFAMAAAVTAKAIASSDAARASQLQAAAIAAFDWAEANQSVASNLASGTPWGYIRGAFAGAAVALYWLTGQSRFDAAFQTWTDFASGDDHQSHTKAETCYLYMRCDADGLATNAITLTNCRGRLEYNGDGAVKNYLGCGGWKNEWHPVNWDNSGIGFASLQAMVYLALLDPSKRARSVAVLSQHRHRMIGANPLNQCYMAGMGANLPTQGLWVDSFARGENPPPGFVCFGEHHGNFSQSGHFNAKSWPDWTSTQPPASESFSAYFDAVPVSEGVIGLQGGMIAPLLFLYAHYEGLA